MGDKSSGSITQATIKSIETCTSVHPRGDGQDAGVTLSDAAQELRLDDAKSEDRLTLRTRSGRAVRYRVSAGWIAERCTEEGHTDACLRMVPEPTALLPDASSECGKRGWWSGRQVIALLTVATAAICVSLVMPHALCLQGPMTLFSHFWYMSPVPVPLLKALRLKRDGTGEVAVDITTTAECPRRPKPQKSPHHPGGRARCVRVRHPGEERVSHVVDCGA